MKIPWTQWLHFGLYERQIRPDDFWQLSPRELFACLGLTQIAPTNREGLQKLMEQFPDESRK